MARDWKAWHHAYDDPSSALSQRLADIVDVLRSVLDEVPPGPVRLISLCCGDARDLTAALADHPRCADVVGRLIELDPELADAGTANLRSIGSRLCVACGDAGNPATFIDAAPADVLLLVGIFGNITDSDVQRLVFAVPSICALGATVIWTRHRRDPDLTPLIAQWFREAGCESATFTSPGRGSFAVGSEHCRRTSPPGRLAGQLFTFRDDL